MTSNSILTHLRKAHERNVARAAFMNAKHRDIIRAQDGTFEVYERDPDGTLLLIGEGLNFFSAIDDAMQIMEAVEK